MKQNERRIPVIGLTGGIGAGKSFVVACMRRLFYVCYINTDQIAKEQMKAGGCSFKRVVETFGKEFIGADGELDRKKLGDYVFNRPEELLRLNAITHPAVNEEVKRLIQTAQEEDEYEYILVESALLIEAGYEDICDDIWYVHARKSTRIARLMESRGYTREQALSVMRRQSSEKFFRAHCDAIIYNEADERRVLRRLRKLVGKYELDVV